MLFVNKKQQQRLPVKLIGIFVFVEGGFEPPNQLPSCYLSPIKSKVIVSKAEAERFGHETPRSARRIFSTPIQISRKPSSWLSSLNRSQK